MAARADGAVAGAQLARAVEHHRLRTTAVDRLEVGPVEADAGLDTRTRQIRAEVGRERALDAEDGLPTDGVRGDLAVGGVVDTSGVNDFA